MDIEMTLRRSSGRCPVHVSKLDMLMWAIGLGGFALLVVGMTVLNGERRNVEFFGGLLLMVGVCYSLYRLRGFRTEDTRPPRRGRAAVQITPESRSRLAAATSAQASSCRGDVLKILFPEKKIEDEQEALELSNRKGDVESGEEEYDCTICQGDFGPGASIVKPHNCNHFYHRHCVMDWLAAGHDDCPICRRPMWKEETYREAEDEVIMKKIQEREAASSSP